MTDYKRNISELGASTDHDDKKLHTKPGRKPLETEPKSKRTAQNRAAQRAYRERKERKMKDLEDKVKLLEDENIKVATELDFLKAQIDMLKSELARYRGHLDFLDLKLPQKVGRLTNPSTGGYMPNFGDAASGTTRSHSSDNSSNKSSVSDSKSPNLSLSNTTPGSYNPNASNSPWSKDYSQSIGGQKQGVPDLISGSSSSTSPLNDNILVSPGSQNNESNFSISNPNTIASEQFEFNLNGNANLNFGEGFEEQLDSFCVKLGEACGTKEQPVPKGKSSQFAHQSPFSTLTNYDNTRKQVKDSFDLDFLNGDPKYNFDLTSTAQDDPLSFLNDNNFDVTLAFDDYPNDAMKERDPISFLTTEESVYDSFSEKTGLDHLINPVQGKLDESISKHSLKDGLSMPAVVEEKINGDEDEVVPAPEKTIKCSEIWDRITSHPKYSEIDIDSLCMELKSKAKCSEKGVVISSADVNTLLEQSALMKR